MNGLTDLADRRCQPCEGGVAPLDERQIAELSSKIGAWEMTKDRSSIFRRFNAGTFAAAVAMIQRIAVVAEDQQHHPDLHLTGYRHLRVELTTHAIGGLTENDFIIAAAIDRLLAHDSP